MSASPADPAEGAAASAPRPTVAQALLVLVAVVIGIGGYIALSASLAIRESYIGFVFVFYWLSLEHGKPQRLPAIVLGACFGLASAWLLQYGVHASHGAPWIALFLALVALAIVCLVLGRLSLVVNTPAMLILTVFTIPHIQQAADFPRLYLALAFAVAYFALFVGALSRLAARRAPQQA